MTCIADLFGQLDEQFAETFDPNFQGVPVPSFEQFQATRTRYEDLSQAPGASAEFYEDSPTPVSGFMYNLGTGCYFIECAGDECYSLTLGNTEEVVPAEDLPRLERALYDYAAREA